MAERLVYTQVVGVRFTGRLPDMTDEERKRKRQERVAKRQEAILAEAARKKKDNQAYYQNSTEWKMPRTPGVRKVPIAA